METSRESELWGWPIAAFHPEAGHSADTRRLRNL